MLVSVTRGGNPALVAETQKDWKFAANWSLPFWDNTRLSAEYIRNRSSDVTSSFPSLTQAVELAFPERVTRDTAGQLVALDQRFVTYEATRSERLVFGLTTRGSFGAPVEQGGPSADSQRREPGVGGPRGRMPGAGGAPSPEQRERFIALREQICADDGLAFLQRLADAVARGEDLSAQYPDIDQTRAQRMLERFLREDDTVDKARLAQFRDRICSMDPSMMRGPGGPRSAEGGPASTGRSGGGRPPGIVSRGFGRDGRGRYFVNLVHTVELDNTILIAAGVPVLDQLGGDATGTFGLSRHSTRLEAGIFRNGKGMRLSGRYTGKARINGSGLPGSSDLFFGDLATFDLRMFFNLGQVFKAQDTFLKNLRVSFRADNVFNARRSVSDADGNVPIAYQPDLIDPTGRFVGIDIRKMF